MKLVFITLIFWSLRCYGQPALNNIYGSETGNSGYAVIPEQNGYFIAGDGSSEQFSLWNAIKLYRIDSLGSVIWEKEFGKRSYHYYTGQGGCAKRINGGDYVIPGSFSDSATDAYSGFVLRVDSLGDTLWTRSYTLGSFTQFNDCIISNDNGIVLVGYTNGLNDPNGDVYVVKLDSNGKFLWQKTYGGYSEDDGLHIDLMLDGGFIISGFTYSFGPGIENNYLIRTDSLGDTLWTRTYGTTDSTNGFCCAAPALDGGIIIFGIWDTILENGISYVAKLDSMGSIKWINLFTDSSYIVIDQVRELADRTIMVASDKNKPPNEGYFDGGALAELDSNGNKLWETLLLYTGPGPYPAAIPYVSGNFYDLQQIRDGGFALTGITTYNIDTLTQVNEIWLVKTDSVGCIDSYCGIEGIEEINQPPAQTNLTIYPNPAYSNVTIAWQPNGNNETSIRIYDMLGRAIKSMAVDGGMGTAQVDISGLVNGMYVVKLLSAEGSVGGVKLGVVR